MWAFTWLFNIALTLRRIFTSPKGPFTKIFNISSRSRMNFFQFEVRQMAAGLCTSTTAPSLSLSSELFARKGDGHSNVSWSSSLPGFKFKEMTSLSYTSTHKLNQGFAVQAAAYTRRSRGEAAKKPNRKSWKQRTDMYMRPFLLNVFFSKRFIHAKVMHRGTSKVISVATTNSKDLRNALPSLTDNDACRVVGELIAERSKEADVYAIAYELKKNERVEGRLAIILDTIQQNGIIFVD